MGSKLRILVHGSIYDTPEVQALEAKGHTVSKIAICDYDVIIGPTCWRMTPELLPYLPLAVKAARAARKEKAA